MPIVIQSLDHLVLTVQDIDRTVSFYENALGMRSIAFGEGRHALHFGRQKINLHAAGHEIAPHARQPTPGSADLCFLTDSPLESVIAHLETLGVSIELGPVDRTGATGPLRSVYCRDPDGNLIEISNGMRKG